MIIALSGAPGCGKDTFANFFKHRSDVEIYSFAEPIRNMLMGAFDWDESFFVGEKKESVDDFFGVSPREMLEYIGTDIMRRDIRNKFPSFDENIGEKIWIKRFEKFYQKNKDKIIIVTDLRFQVEYDFLKSLDVKTIKIVRLGVEEKKVYDINNFSFDFVLENDSTKKAFENKSLDLFKNIALGGLNND